MAVHRWTVKPSTQTRGKSCSPSCSTLPGIAARPSRCRAITVDAHHETRASIPGRPTDGRRNCGGDAGRGRRVDRCLLRCGQRPGERNRDSVTVGAVVTEPDAEPCSRELLLDLAATASWEQQLVGDLLVTRDNARRLMGREPGSLSFKEFRVGERGGAAQARARRLLGGSDRPGFMGTAGLEPATSRV